MAKYPKGEPLKRGRRVLGTIVTSNSGVPVYLHHRNSGDIWKHREPTISDAIRKGVATWSIEEEILVRMRARGIRFAGIFCRDTGDIWLTKVERFFDRTRCKVRQAPNYITYCELLLGEFCRRHGAVKL